MFGQIHSGANLAQGTVVDIDLAIVPRPADVIVKVPVRIRPGDEVIVIDDGSNDDTSKIASLAGAEVILRMAQRITELQRHVEGLESEIKRLRLKRRK